MGKQLLYANLLIVSLGLGLTTTRPSNVHADVTPKTPTAQSDDQVDTNQSQQVVLAKKEAATDGDKNAAGNDADAEQLSGTVDDKPAPDSKGDDQQNGNDDGAGQNEAAGQNDDASDPDQLSNGQGQDNQGNADLEKNNQSLTGSRGQKASAIMPESETLTDDAPAVYATNAQVWMPDAALRNLVEQQLSQQLGQTVTDANLNNFVDTSFAIQSLSLKANSLEGLQRFTNLQAFVTHNTTLPLAGMIDFSFAPNLQSFSIIGQNNWNIALNDLLTTYFSGNKNIRILSILDAGLTGDVTGLTAYKNLESINLSENELTGDIPSLTNWPKMIKNGSIALINFSRNHMTSGFYKDSNTPYSIYSSTVQQVVAQTPYTVSQVSQATGFNPFADNLGGLQNTSNGSAAKQVFGFGKIKGNIILGYTPADITQQNIYSLDLNGVTDGRQWFDFVKDDSVIGYKLVAKAGVKVPVGSYVVYLMPMTYNKNSQLMNTSDYTSWFTFQVKADPVVEPTTKPTDTVTDGRVIVQAIDDHGNVLNQTILTGHVGDQFTATAPQLAGYQVIGATSTNGIYTDADQNVTFNYAEVVSDGAGDKGTTATVIRKKSGAADRVVNSVAKKTTTKTLSARATTHQVKSVAKNHAVKPTVAKATMALPQTDEQSGGLKTVLAGLAVLFTSLIFWRKEN